MTQPDRIEHRMDDDGHQLWGFVIYRTTYDSASERDWPEFLRRIRWQVEDEMEDEEGEEVLEHFQLTVFDDRNLFDGADTATIRRHFQQWAEKACPAEQGDGVDMGLSPRYRYCIQVDAEALHSVVQLAPPPEEDDISDIGWVKLIDKNWFLQSEHPLFRDRPRDPEVYKPIEGITQEDVGWVKCRYWTVMVLMYVLLENPNGWVLNYARPPAVISTLR